MSFDDLANRMKDRQHGYYGAPISSSSGESGGGLIVLGLILLIVGIAITVITHDQASRQGGTYIVAYGPILWGGITLFRGLARLGR